MIAPYREGGATSQRNAPEWRRARRTAAALLLGEQGESKPSPPTPTIAAWKAWLVVAWMTLAAAVYVMRMVELF